jgi:hypothetical protein
MDFDTRDRIERDYRRAGRMIERNKPADA